MLEELVSQKERLTPVIIDHTIVLLVGGEETDDTVFNAYLYSLTEDVQNHIDQVLDLSVSIGISLPVESFHGISMAYREGWKHSDTELSSVKASLSNIRILMMVSTT